MERAWTTSIKQVRPGANEVKLPSPHDDRRSQSLDEALTILPNINWGVTFDDVCLTEHSKKLGTNQQLGLKMQSRTLLRRLLILRPSKPSNPAISSRPFTRHTNLASHTRPQLPFLSVPLTRNHQFRYLTTERKRWLAYEVFLGAKYTVYIWAIVGFSVVGYWCIQQEWLERKYPTPDEWTFLTRLRFRLAKWAPDRTDLIQTNWVQIGGYAKNVLERLEDRSIDGAGIQDLTEGGVWIDGIGESGYDVTAKSEPWRRGYYEALMLCAKSAEHLDNHLVDTTRHVVFPADQVLGPSNPNPKPIPHGSPSAPHEKDCEPAYEAPEIFYMRILTTRGFTPKQKMDAALDYASWLDFKGIPDASERMYEWALSLAHDSALPTPLPYDPQSYVLRDDVGRPSANLLTTLTALAAHKARNEDLSTALPILISILRACRALPRPQATTESYEPELTEEVHASPWTMANIVGVGKRLMVPPSYPPPPDDGESPPVRDAKELCEEAGLNLYIGEIIYAGASKGTSSSREDGLAWTREAVDLAEEQLSKLSPDSSDAEATKTCKECLGSGLENWAKMVGRLAREEREREAAGPDKASGCSWLGLWGEGKAETTGRWAAEEHVVKERMRRAEEILDELEAPKTGLGAIFWA
ncbi:Uu.00g110800.m01.CDS01 [Anthostomella pinea]|uniref:Uu.00g110800.m01.CDS01 n=1 Tax=Anthostomella pinea TaxID=933095 RepID=A0AAI8VF17_9PEZI|nr:Uu.00g110800.m01.CDS01 [Anthostomella pinea]